MRKGKCSVSVQAAVLTDETTPNAEYFCCKTVAFSAMLVPSLKFLRVPLDQSFCIPHKQMSRREQGSQTPIHLFL